MKKSILVLLLVAGLYYAYQIGTEKILPANIKIDRLVVRKADRKLDVFTDGQLIKTYTIALGKQPLGDKQYEGDNKTPEGHYTINDKNPHSSYYKNLGVSYPSAADRREAVRLGKPTGGDIKIHGLPNKLHFLGRWHRLMDWTAGCMAVTDDEMEELYHAVPIGTPIEINP